MELVIQVEILDKAVYISLCANALGKGVNPSVFLPAMGSRIDWVV